MHEHVEVIRLESQLTVPTRNHPDLSDVWIAIASQTRLSEWSDVFNRLAASNRMLTSGAGNVQLVCMSDRRGWIVLRGTDLRRSSLPDLEAKVRQLVIQVNSAVSATSETAARAPRTIPWSHRLRLALRARAHAAVTPSRRRAGFDAPSVG